MQREDEKKFYAAGASGSQFLLTSNEFVIESKFLFHVLVKTISNFFVNLLTNRLSKGHFIRMQVQYLHKILP